MSHPKLKSTNPSILRNRLGNRLNKPAITNLGSKGLKSPKKALNSTTSHSFGKRFTQQKQSQISPTPKNAHSKTTLHAQNLLTLRHQPPQFTLLNNSSTKCIPSITCYSQLGLEPKVVDAIHQVIATTFPHNHQTLSIRPTEIQTLAALNLLSPTTSLDCIRALILAAETGTGKTLAYLGPIMHILRSQELQYANEYSKYTDALDRMQTKISTIPTPDQQPSNLLPNLKLPPKPIPLRRQGYPRAIVLVPSHELVYQVLHVAKSLSHTARVRVASATTNTPGHHLRRILTDPVDLFITTPGSLAQFVEKQYLSLSDLNVLVVDEADFIVDQGFAEDTDMVITSLKKVLSTRTPSHGYPSVVFVSATVPKSLYKWVQSKFSSFSAPQFITSNALHRPLPKCKQQFVDVARQFQSNQHAALLDVLQNSHSVQTGSALVFVNQRVTVDLVHSYLSSTKQFPTVLRLSKLQTTQERAAAWDLFKKTPGAVMVATDVAARGLDSTHVQLVVNFDIPNSALEYLHRIGRTARAGRPGLAISLVTKRSRELVLAIQQRLKAKADFGMELI